MWNVMPHPGLASAVLDSTDDLSLLSVGRVCLGWLSAGMIVLAAIQECRSQKTPPVTGTASTAADRREAA